MMKFEVERARDWFRQGLPLIGKVDRELAIDLDLFSRGGQEILNAIEKQGYAVLGNRPAISKPRKLALVARAAMAKLFGSSSEDKHERRHPAGPHSLDSRSAAARHGVFRMQGHHPHRGQEFLLRLPRPAAPQARSAVRRLRLHAPLRRHHRRPHAEPARAPPEARHLARRSAPRPAGPAHRRCHPARPDRRPAPLLPFPPGCSTNLRTAPPWTWNRPKLSRKPPALPASPSSTRLSKTFASIAIASRRSWDWSASTSSDTAIPQPSLWPNVAAWHSSSPTSFAT